MNIFRILYNLVRTDILGRLRSYSFLIILGLTIFIAYMSVPPIGANYLVLGLDNIRGIYNSAWIGGATAIVVSTMLSLPAFYLVKGSIKRDKQTGVGQIIATTPLSKAHYIFGKILGNFLFLSVMVAAIAFSAGIMQIIRGEEAVINLWKLLSPFLFIVLPTMFFVSALAVFFETISWLSGSFGNIAYFFLWLGLYLIYPVTSMARSGRAVFDPLKEVTGMTIPLSSMSKAAASSFPDYIGGSGLIKFNVPVKTFVWEGLDWNLEIISSRLIWVGIALVIGTIASIFFKRFDPSLEKRKVTKTDLELQPQEITKIEVHPVIRKYHLTPLSLKAFRFSVGKLLIQELRLMVKGLGWWWYVVALGFIISGALVPIDILLKWILPITWIWPLVIWSKMGSRELYYRTNQYIFAAAYPLKHHLPITLLAGIIIAFTTGVGTVVNLAVNGELLHLLALIVAAVFIPSLALSLGILSGGRKLFEVVYIILWYIGPMSQGKYLDYMGVSSTSIKVQLSYFIATIALIGIAFLGRMKKLKI
jgi:hypothetical protein